MKKSKRVVNNVIFFVLLALSVLFLVPIIIVIINSFKSQIYISSQPLKLPNAETFVALENYINGVTSSDFFSAFFTLPFYYCCKRYINSSLCFNGGLVYRQVKFKNNKRDLLYACFQYDCSFPNGYVYNDVCYKPCKS